MVVISSPGSSSEGEGTNYIDYLLHKQDMAHWLHCNGCYCQPDSGSELRFYLTNCSHIYCDKCVTPCTKEQCKICRSQCSTLMLGGKIPKEIENLFSDPIDLVQKFSKQFYQIIEFQKSHQRRLLRRLKDKVKACDRQIGEVKNVLIQARSMEREFLKLKSENDYLKLLISKREACPRGSSRTGISPGPFTASPNNPSPLGRNQKQQNNHSRVSNILNQPGRLLVRTPPSGGKLGTVGGLNYTPCDMGNQGITNTPLSIPRPIHFSHHNE